MYDSILVTLDESDLAERSLPHAAALAKAFGSTIHLLSVVPVTDPEAMREMGVAVDWEARLSHARDYLKALRKRVMDDGVEVEWDVCQGDVTEEILNYSDQQECSLIVMSTHGRSGLGRWVYGSIADKVLRHASVPVLLVRASEGE